MNAANDYSQYLPYIDVAEGRGRIRNNVKLYLSLLGSFARGDYAGRVRRAYQVGNAEELRAAVHTVKGTAANLSFNALAQACRDYEQVLKSESATSADFAALMEVFDRTLEAMDRLRDALSSAI